MVVTHTTHTHPKARVHDAVTNIVISSSNTPRKVATRRERCSRPLCSSQHTVGTPPNHRTHVPEIRQESEKPSPSTRQHHAPGTTGVRSLRTQQRARHPYSPDTRVPTTRRWRTNRCRRFRTTNRRCSTHELTTAEQMPAKWLWQPAFPPDCRCSLERR